VLRSGERHGSLFARPSANLSSDHEAQARSSGFCKGCPSWNEKLIAATEAHSTLCSRRHW